MYDFKTRELQGKEPIISITEVHLYVSPMGGMKLTYNQNLLEKIQEKKTNKGKNSHIFTKRHQRLAEVHATNGIDVIKEQKPMGE